MGVGKYHPYAKFKGAGFSVGGLADRAAYPYVSLWRNYFPGAALQGSGNLLKMLNTILTAYRGE
jgi:hypothetical protein